MVDNNGNLNSVKGSYLNSSGDTNITYNGYMSITQDGIVTIQGKPDAHGIMNIDKDMMVMTMNDGGGCYNLIVSIRYPAAGFDAADFDMDGDVDFAVFAERWLN